MQLPSFTNDYSLYSSTLGIQDLSSISPSSASLSTLSLSSSIKPRDFPSYTGVVIFEDLVSIAAAVLKPIIDGVPEYDEKYIFRLVNVTG